MKESALTSMKFYGYRNVIQLVLLCSVWCGVRSKPHAQSECGKNDLLDCISPIQMLVNNDFGFVNSKSELDNICPTITDALLCIRNYSRNCMSPLQQRYFRRLYTDTITTLQNMCHEGPYQQEYLQHASCILKTRTEYENCSAKYFEATKVGSTGKQSKQVQSVCCSFQEYQHCMEHAVREKCGEGTSEFVKSFIYKMADSPTKAQCGKYLSASEICHSGQLAAP